MPLKISRSCSEGDRATRELAILAWRGAILLFLVLLSAEAQAATAKPITKAELAQMLQVSRSKSDSNLSHDLAEVRLTESVDEGSLTQMATALPGDKSRRAFRLLADQAVFLAPNGSSEINDPIPDREARARILSLTVEYVKKTISKLPNFYATRSTTWFADRPKTDQSEYIPIRVVGTANQTVLYRDGKEVIDTSGKKGHKTETGMPGVVTSGEYGPILVTALVDLSHGTVFWSRWEKMDDFGAPSASNTTGKVDAKTDKPDAKTDKPDAKTDKPDAKTELTRKQAVFRFSVPRNKSHYGVTLCCMTGKRAGESYKQFPAYHGEIAIDPESGAILRLMIRADLEPTDLVSRADTVVTFGPVEIGGLLYICPLRSVTASVAPMRFATGTRDRFRSAYDSDSKSVSDLPQATKFLQTFISDVAFERYHLFRSETRMIF